MKRNSEWRERKLKKSLQTLHGVKTPSVLTCGPAAINYRRSEDISKLYLHFISYFFCFFLHSCAFSRVWRRFGNWKYFLLSCVQAATFSLSLSLFLPFWSTLLDIYFESSMCALNRKKKGEKREKASMNNIPTGDSIKSIQISI